ncbi:MAG: cytochrome bc complex cytochrome b subunit [Frankiaceae bacterium]
MTTTTTRGAGRKRGSAAGRAGADSYRFVNDRVNGTSFIRHSMNKAFPTHWSFMIGEIALYSFIIVLLSGVFLTMFFEPSNREVIYNGSYAPLHGLKMSQAYASTLSISFDIRGGLLMRQLHHWAALIFIGAVAIHSLRVFFTGAFRKPREINWLIGVGLLTLAIFEGFAGYSLPDDLLSGTGLRIGYSMLESIPVVGSWLAMFIFGGEFPGQGFLHRLYAVHILLLPGIILALVTAHLMIIWHQKHTDFPGPGKSEETVVGTRFYPGYVLKGGGYTFLVFGVCALLGGLAQINPIWYYGPFTPAQVSAGSQPDFYMGFLEGSLRIMPGWEWHVWGQTIPFNLLIPGLILPGLMFTSMALYPFIERKWITKDNSYHELLDRPRDNPTRTGIGWMGLSFYLVLLVAGGNDIIAKTLHISLYATTWIFRFAIILVPPIAFYLAKRVCLGLLSREEDEHHHGIETGTIKRLPHGEVIEVHAPVPPARAAVLEATPDGQPAHIAQVGEPDEREPAPVGRQTVLTGARERLSSFFYEREDPEREDDR